MPMPGLSTEELSAERNGYLINLTDKPKAMTEHVESGHHPPSLGKFDSGRILIRERETAAARRRSTATGKLTDQFGYSLPPSLSHSLDLDLCAVKIRSMAFLADT